MHLVDILRRHQKGVRDQHQFVPAVILSREVLAVQLVYWLTGTVEGPALGVEEPVVDDIRETDPLVDHLDDEGFQLLLHENGAPLMRRAAGPAVPP